MTDFAQVDAADRSEADDSPGPPLAEVTVFSKHGGKLTKRIHLVDGKVSNDSSKCRMFDGDAKRVWVDPSNMAALADLINGLRPNQAYANGRMKEGVPDCVRVVTDAMLASFNGDPGVIARTQDYFGHDAGKPSICLIDVDLDGMSKHAKRQVQGRVWEALCSVVPQLATTARVVRPSTSFGLRNKITGEDYPGSGGFHFAIVVADGADIERFLKALHNRLWLRGFGWIKLSAVGAFLDRSLADTAVASPERLIFEGPPVVIRPLVQGPRLAVAFEGDILDTATACPPLTKAERDKVQELKKAEMRRLKPESVAQREKWSASHVKRMVANGTPEKWARKQVDGWLDHKEVSGDFPLPFDDAKLAGTTVDAVLADPNRFLDKPLADPFEGVAYGRGKARIYKRDNGTLFIKSFAHGDARYELKAAPKPPPTKFKLVAFEDIKFMASSEWLVKKLLPRQGVAPIFGPSQTFKSFVCMDLALHVALGWPWAGRKTEQGAAVYIAAENSAGTRKRKVGFEQAHDANLPPGRVAFYLVESAPNLGTEKNDLEALIASVEAVGVSPALIVIDTLAQTLGGGEENTTGMQTFLTNATALADHFKCCVVPVHHTPLADANRMRGWSGLYAGVDALFRAERQGVDLVTALTLAKLKDEESNLVLTVRLGRIVLGEDEDGEELSTLVVTGIEAGAPEQAADKGKAEGSIPRGRKLLMEVTAQAIDEVGQDFPSFPNGPTVRAVGEPSLRSRYYIRVAEQAEPDEDTEKLEGRRRKAFARALKAAIDAKDLMARGREGVRMLWLP